MRRVCLVSSGTGGHLVPAMALSSALRADGHETMFVTEGRPVESSLLNRDAAAAECLAVGRGLGMPFRMFRAMLAARRVLRQSRVDLVLCTGGRTSLPVGLAARSLGLPLCLLEQNAKPGRANRLLARLARRVYLGLPTHCRLPRALLTGTPLRPEIGRVDRAVARSILELDAKVPVILVTGGSQGARALNEIVPAALTAVPSPLQVLHLSGTGADHAVRTCYASAQNPQLSYVVRPMVTDMANYYAAADLVICRGGGATVAELMAAARPAIIIPYPHHRDRQQLHNGRVLADVGAARILEQQYLTADTLRAVLVELLSQDRLQDMGKRAGAIGRPNACQAILADLKAIANLN